MQDFKFKIQQSTAAAAGLFQRILQKLNVEHRHSQNIRRHEFGVGCLKFRILLYLPFDFANRLRDQGEMIFKPVDSNSIRPLAFFIRGLQSNGSMSCLQIRLNHEFDKVRKFRLGLPAKFGLRLRRVSKKNVHLGGAIIRRINDNMVLPRKSDA